MKKYSLLLVLLLAATRIFAQGEFTIELDLATGTFVKTSGAIPGIHWVYMGGRAYDEVNGRLIFQGGLNVPDHLYSMDVTNGTVVTSPLVPQIGSQNVVVESEMDNTTGIMYGIYREPSLNAFYLATVDPATGIYTAVGVNSIPGLTTFTQGMDTYDEIHHRYIIYTTNQFFSVDAQTGDLITFPTSNVVSPDYLMHIRYNNANDTLYGLLAESASQLYFLVWIDPATGVVTKIGNGSSLMAGTGSGTIDQSNRRYIFCNYNLGGFYLYAMSLVTGDLIYNNLIPLDQGDNVGDMEYDNVRQKLFGIHWDAVISPPLAIHLASFDAQRKGKSTAIVSWKALGLAGNEQFEVEHSADGRTFATIANLTARKGKEDYSVDHQMQEGNNYYRLRTTEIDGEISYSNIVRLSLSPLITDVVLLPNIVSDKTTLHITTGDNNKAALLVTDAIGKQVYKGSAELQKGLNPIVLDLSFLALGSYTMQVVVGNEAPIPLKFVKL